MKEIFLRLQKLTDKNEEDHVLKAIKQIDTARQCQKQMAEWIDYDQENWRIILNNFNTMQGILTTMMENRANVTTDHEMKNELLDLKKKFALISETYVKICENARYNNYPQPLLNKVNIARDRLLDFTNRFEQILKFGIAAFSSFKHTPIEPEKFGEQLGEIFFIFF